MANWYANARTNYFRVKNRKRFEQLCELLELELIQRQEESGELVGFYSNTEHGGWPGYVNFTLPDEKAQHTKFRKLIPTSARKLTGPVDGVSEYEIDLAQAVAAYLCKGEVAVLMCTGAEKLRYLTGQAIAVDHTGKELLLDLEQIYDLARDHFGVEPTQAVS